MGRYKTWEDECLPRLVVHAQDGSVALCVLWNLVDQIIRRLPPEIPGLGVVGNLRTPLGISWFVRGLWQLPRIHKVVLWGSDLTNSGQALVRLWEEGVAQGHQVPGFGWQLDTLVPVDAIDELRRSVCLVDRRTQRLEDIVHELSAREPATPREIRSFPPVPVPDLQFWPSRASAIHIEAKDIAHAWLGVLQTIMHCGKPRATRKKERIAHFFDFMVSFPVPEVEEIHPCFDLTPADLEKYASQVLSPVRPPDVEYWYGERMQNWHEHNQLQEVIDRLKKAPDTKRATIAILEASDLSTLEDAPCFTTATFSIDEDHRLHASYVFRSHDMYGGWPSNVFAILRVHRYVAEQLGCDLGRATFHSQNAQIYERHWPQAQEKLTIFGPSLTRVSELLKFKQDPVGNFVFAITKERTVSGTYMSGNDIVWEVEHREPYGLVAWIVASMPWLSGNHILYLGKQAERLHRALKEGGEYVQG